MEPIAEYLKESTQLCKEQGWGSYKDQGVFPYCLWKEAPIAEAFYYSKVDIPFVAGLTDGLYGELEGLVLLPKMFYDLSKGMQEFIYAYTWAKLQCTPNKVAMNQKRMGLLLEKLEREQAETSIWSWVKEQWYTGQKELTEYKGKRCEDAEKLRNEVDEFVDFVKEIENIKKLIEEVQANLADYWKQIEQKTNVGRYEEGKITVIVGSLFISAGALAATKIGRIKQILQKLRSFTKGQWDEFFGEANRRVGKKLANIENLLDKNLIEELRIAGVSFDENTLIGLVKSPDGEIVWLDKGLNLVDAQAISVTRRPAGFAHIIEEHGIDFVKKGITETELPEFLLKAVKENNIVDRIGSTSRPVFELSFKGVKQRVAITISNNGYIVGANPISF